MSKSEFIGPPVPEDAAEVMPAFYRGLEALLPLGRPPSPEAPQTSMFEDGQLTPGGASLLEMATGVPAERFLAMSAWRRAYETAEKEFEDAIKAERKAKREAKRAASTATKNKSTSNRRRNHVSRRRPQASDRPLG